MTTPLPDLVRSYAHDAQRRPAENAFRALACLSDADLRAALARFNDTFGRRTPPLTITLHVGASQ